MGMFVNLPPHDTSAVSHAVRMAYHLAGIDVECHPCLREAKPQWHIDMHNGSMPCLAPNGLNDGSGSMSDSLTIAKVALPSGPLDDAAMACSQGLFPAIAKLIKNTDPVCQGADVELRQNLDAALAKLETLLVETQNPFFSGTHPGLADSMIATKLYVLSIAAAHYKSYTLDLAKHPALVAYEKRVAALPAFTETQYDANDAILGWGEARGGGH